MVDHMDKKYADWFFDIMNKIKSVIRSDPEINNYQFKSFEIVGSPRVAESDMPCIRIVPDEDDIQQLETQTRRHRIHVDVYVFDHKPIKGEESYKTQVLLAGRVYDVLMSDRSLGNLALDSSPQTVKTIGAFSEQGTAVNHVSRIRLYIESDKNE